jgi:hypothetical protein
MRRPALCRSRSRAAGRSAATAARTRCALAAGRYVSSQLASHYARFEHLGFRNAYLDQDSPLCTYCNENPVAGGRGRGGSIIDHVLVRGGSVRARAHRIFDGDLTVEAEGKRVTTALSDHYGVLAEIEAAD